MRTRAGCCESRIWRRRVPGRAASATAGSLEGHARLQLLEHPLRHALAVVAHRQPRLEGVAGAVGGALDAHAEQRPRSRRAGRRRRAAASSRTPATRCARGCSATRSSSRRAGPSSVDALGPDLGGAGAAVALDDPADGGRGEAVARPHEARQRRLDDHRQPHRELRRGVPEALRTARRLGAQLEVREVVGQLHRDRGDCRRRRPRSPGCSTAPT